MSILPLHYTFPHPLGVITSKLKEENLIDEVEKSFIQLFVGVTYEDEPLESLKFLTIFERAMQNWTADYLSSRRKFR